MDKTWKLYVLRCGDGSLYTGITMDVQARLEMHRSGKGAKYTRGRGPLELVYSEECGSHSDALKREIEVKAMSREEKNEVDNVVRACQRHALLSLNCYKTGIDHFLQTH